MSFTFSIILYALLAALVVTGIVVLLFIALSPVHARMEPLHWMAAAICVIVSSLCLSVAFGAARAVEIVNSGAESINGYTEEALSSVGNYLPEELLENGLNLKDMADTRVESVREYLDGRLTVAVIWTSAVTLVLNLLLFLLLMRTAGKKSRKSSFSDDFEDSLDGDYGSLSGSLDNIDDEL